MIHHRMGRSLAAAAWMLASTAPAFAALQVVSTDPARHTQVAATTSVSVTFDQALQTSSVTGSSVRVFGRQTGPRERWDHVLERQQDVDAHADPPLRRRRNGRRHPVARPARRRHHRAAERRLRVPVRHRRRRGRAELPGDRRHVEPDRPADRRGSTARSRPTSTATAGSISRPSTRSAQTCASS